jgi:hypothetical protein
MKIVAVVAAFLFWGAVGETINAPQAKDHIGEYFTVCGKVVSQHTASGSRGEPTFLDVDAPYPHQVFTIVIWKDDIERVGELPSVKSRVCASGVIREYKGVANIFVRTAGQFSK